MGVLKLDKRGNRLLAAEETPINTPAVAAAYAKKSFQGSQPDHLSLHVRIPLTLLYEEMDRGRPF